MAPAVKGNLVYLTPIIELRSPATNKELIEYLEANHNLMIFGDSDAKKPVRSLVNEFGTEFEAVVSYKSFTYIRGMR